MTRLAQLTALRDRVMAATGADRELDDRIYVVLRDINPRWGIGGRVTASIDAALALIERVLPGEWEATLRAALNDLVATRVKLVPAPVETRTPIDMLPLAILAALLSALIAKETDHAE